MSISSILEKTKREKDAKKTPSFSKLVLAHTLYNLGIDENTVRPDSTLGKIFQETQRVSDAQSGVLRNDALRRGGMPMAPLHENMLNIAGSVRMFEQELGNLPSEAFMGSDNDNDRNGRPEEILDINEARRNIKRSAKRSGGGIGVGARTFGQLFFTELLSNVGIDQHTSGRKTFFDRQFRKSELIQARIAGSHSLSFGSEKPLGQGTPSLTTFSSHIDKLSEVSSSILNVVKDQFDLNKRKYADARRIEAEINQEDDIPDAVKISGQMDAEKIGPLRETIDEFIKALDRAIDSIKNFTPGGGGGGGIDIDGFGLGRRRGTPTGKGRKLPRGVRPDQLLDKNGRPLRGAARQSRIDKLLRESAKKPTREMIRRLVAPKIAKTGLKTFAKSIPVAGAVIGVGFAIKKLAEGDVVGAGLEAASGLAGPITAVPAAIASITRDIYKDVYGINPEEDPFYDERFPELFDTVKEAVGDDLEETTPKPTVKPKTGLSGVKKQSITKTAPTKSISSIPSHIPTGTSSSVGSAISGGGGSSLGSPISSSSSGSSGSSDADLIEKNPIQITQPEPTSEAMKKEMASDIGSHIDSLSVEIDSLSAVPGQSTSDRTQNIMNPSPSFNKSGYVSTNNVPNPEFSDIVTFLDQVYM